MKPRRPNQFEMLFLLSVQFQTRARPRMGEGEEGSAAYWRAVAAGLQYENRELHILVQQLLGLAGQASGVEVRIPDEVVVAQKMEAGRGGGGEERSSKDGKKNNGRRKSGTDSGRGKGRDRVAARQQESEAGRDREAELAYREFARVTAEHRAGREAEREEAEPELPPESDATQQEMAVLYGSAALKVHCVETGLQLQFDQWCDNGGALEWPALPLNLTGGN